MLKKESLGGTDGKVTLLFSRVIENKKPLYQLKIISKPKHYASGRMKDHFSLVFCHNDIALFESKIGHLLDTTEYTNGLSIGNVEFNFFQNKGVYIPNEDVAAFVELDKRLGACVIRNSRKEIELPIFI